MGNTGIKDEKEFGRFAEGFLRFSSLFRKLDAPSVIDFSPVQVWCGF
jgi:hypothetical protein